ncbi:MAG: DUF4013 domain-containing protein [Deltaproteobacteria bacterium]|nr:DUF4013 domain-containing protein [Deltaproteobacteria bacterium]
MDLKAFIQFTFNSKYILRWVLPGIVIYIPVLNFISLGYLSRMARLLLLGNIGLPTWENKSNMWMEGIRIILICVLYEAIPFFIFSCGFFLSTMPGIVGFFGKVCIKLSYPVFLLFTFPLPFALSVYIEYSDLKKAFDYEKILEGIKEVIFYYISGYVLVLLGFYVAKSFIRIPYLGFFISSLATYYLLLLSCYFFVYLFKKTSLPQIKLES